MGVHPEVRGGRSCGGERHRLWAPLILRERIIESSSEVELPFTTAEIVPLRRRKPLPECVYPKIRKAAE
jgi:hypothetical protein